jgi:hypothetical protein
MSTAIPPAGKPSIPVARAKAIPQAGAPQQQMAAARPMPQQPSPQQQPAKQAEQPPPPSGTRNSRFVMMFAMPSWAVSAIVHFFVIIAMALIPIAGKIESGATMVVAKASEVSEEIEELKDDQIQLDVKVTEVSSETSEVVQQMALENAVETTTIVDVASNDVDAAAVQVELSDIGSETAPKSDLMASIGAYTGSGLAGRGAAQRGKMRAAAGGTGESEAAVARALKWFADHQNPDGSWNFDHRTGPCNGRCGNPGDLKDCRTGATAMALLPFLGSGQTHKQGEYKRNVEAGLYFLTSQMKITGNRGDLAQAGGSMYSHGIASIVLCEAYAMTQDRALATPAQLAINHIVYAQDPVGGGWRYQPRTPGDTSAVGWQLMALKSGHMAYLNVPKETIAGAVKFLDSVQTESGARYGYTGPGNGAATSAVGLLSRMYLGWKKDHPGIERGTEIFAQAGPSKGNMYFNYYATQVMRHYEGERWDKWNKEMRDYLVSSQDRNAHQNGSWFFAQGGDHGSSHGGRIYCTSMATMILEVYYRHMPIYGKAAATDDFPL